MIKSVHILAFILIFALNDYAQCFKKNTTFKIGEEITHHVYYNWGIIWVKAGWVTFKVHSKKYNGRDVYFFDSYGSSFKSYDWLFKVRDSYRTYLDKETLKPLWYHRKNYEGGFEADYKYLFDYNKKKIYSSTWNTERPHKDTVISMPKECFLDVLSLVYYCRSIDFSRLKKNQKVPLKAFLDNEFYDLYIRYRGKETITTKSGETYKCAKFSALLVEGTIFKGGEDLLIWVTDDDNRMPVMVEAKIVIGSVKSYLVKSNTLSTNQ